MTAATDVAPARRAVVDAAGTTVWIYRLALTLLGTTFLMHAVSQHGFAGDLLMDIANGRWILVHHTLPLSNELNPTQHGVYWSQPEWLYGVYVAWLWLHAGPLGVWFGLVPIVGGLVFGIVRATEAAGYLWGSVLTMAVVVSLHGFMAPRPQLISYALFVAGLWAMQRWRTGQAWPVWAVAGSTLVWSQIHASALLVPLLIAGEWVVGPRRRGLVGPLVLASVAWAIKPGGIFGGSSLLSTLMSPAIRQSIQEWAPWHPLSPVGLVFLPWMAVAMVVLVLAVRRRDWAHVLWVTAGATATVLAVRFAAYFVLGMAVVLAEVIRPRRLPPSTAYGWLGMLALSGLATALFALRSPRFPVREPVRAMAVLRADHVHEVFAYYPYGDALDLYGPPSFADGRAELWSRTRWWAAFTRTQAGDGSPARFVARWAPSVDAILWPVDKPGARALNANSRWEHTRTLDGVGIWIRSPGGDVP